MTTIGSQRVLIAEAAAALGLSALSSTMAASGVRRRGPYGEHRRHGRGTGGEERFALCSGLPVGLPGCVGVDVVGEACGHEEVAEVEAGEVGGVVEPVDAAFAEADGGDAEAVALPLRFDAGEDGAGFGAGRGGEGEVHGFEDPGLKGLIGAGHRGMILREGRQEHCLRASSGTRVRGSSRATRPPVGLQ